MRPMLQKRSALKYVGRIIPHAKQVGMHNKETKLQEMKCRVCGIREIPFVIFKPNGGDAI